jgi:hypothetical protein
MAEQGAFGVQLKISVSATLTIVANLLDVAFPEFEKYLADSTAHDSSGGYVEYISSGVRELKEFKATLGWDTSETTHAAIVTAFDSDDYVAMSIEDPNGNEVIAFNAHIKKIGRIGKIKEMFKCDVTIQPTGQPTIT